MQLDLFSPRAPDTSADETALLVHWLRDRDWQKAKAITTEFPAWNDRKIRALANRSRGRIISGQKGYKLTLQATPDEIEHAANFLRSQARSMLARSIRITRVFHSNGRAPK